MSLNKKQFHFEKMCNLLEQYMLFMGYQYSTGDCRRDKLCKYVSPKSFHHKRLARDYLLFKFGKYITKTSDHAMFGAFWKLLGGTWGGDFLTREGNRDGNHYSLGEGKR